MEFRVYKLELGSVNKPSLDANKRLNWLEQTLMVGRQEGRPACKN